MSDEYGGRGGRPFPRCAACAPPRPLRAPLARGGAWRVLVLPRSARGRCAEPACLPPLPPVLTGHVSSFPPVLTGHVPPGALTRAEPAPGEDRVARAEGEGAARRHRPVLPRGPRDAP